MIRNTVGGNGMVRIAICDDEEYYQIHIKHIIEMYLQNRRIMYHISTFFSGEDFCEQNRDSVEYDIVFLDIEMNKMNGMEVAYKIRELNPETEIVFVTVMMEYALEGYHVNARRYLLKENLERLIPECLSIILKSRNQYLSERRKFSFIGGEREIIVSDVYYVESKLHKLCFVRAEDNLYMYAKLNQVESELEQYGFVRTHQSYLVNMRFIIKINNYLLYLSNGDRIPVVKSRYSSVKDKFLRFKERL